MVVPQTAFGLNDIKRIVLCVDPDPFTATGYHMPIRNNVGLYKLRIGHFLGWPVGHSYKKSSTSSVHAVYCVLPCLIEIYGTFKQFVANPWHFRHPLSIFVATVRF